jgi:Domain of unknown function (DUF4304)
MSDRLNVKMVRKGLFGYLSPELAKYGFTARLSDSAFRRKFPHGQQSIHFQFIYHIVDVDACVDIAVRFDQLEDLINKHKSYLTEKEKKDTWSLGAELGNIHRGAAMRWTMYSGDDIEQASKDILEVIISTAIPSLEKYSDMSNALDAVSGDGPNDWLYSPFDNERAMRAIGLAFLLGDRTVFSQLAKAKTEFLTVITRQDQLELNIRIFLELRNELEEKLS